MDRKKSTNRINARKHILFKQRIRTVYQLLVFQDLVADLISAQK